MRQFLSLRGARLLLGLALAAGVAGWACSSGEQSAIDLSVDIESGLALDKLAIRVSAAGKPNDLHLDVSVTRNPVPATIFVSGLATGAVVTVEVSGIAGPATVVIGRASVSVIRGQHVALTMTLAADCAGIVSCDTSQTCEGGRCVPIAQPVVDAGAPDAAAGRAGEGGAAGLGGGAGHVATGGRGGAGALPGGGGEAGRGASGGNGGQTTGGRSTGGGAAGGGSSGSGGVMAGAGGVMAGAGGVGAGTGGMSAGTGGMSAGTGGMSAGTGGMSAGTGGASAACTTAQHRCGGVCVDDASIDHCGPTSCSGCPTPADGTATCDGTSCGFDCGARKKCAAAMLCIATDGCCTSAECTGGGPGQVGTCDAGTHQCSYGCPAMTKSCTVGNTTSCIALDACCAASDCAGPCRTCDASHACVALIGQDDPTGRCTGACDATGVCKSKLGQGCSDDSSCGAGVCSNGFCCTTRCLGSTAPCAGSCAGNTSGVCQYSQVHCTPDSCPTKVNQGVCNNSGDNGLCYYPSGCF